MKDGAQQAESVETVEDAVPAESATSGRLPFFSISPKWQLILIGGVFIAINLMVMILFVVALILRRS